MAATAFVLVLLLLPLWRESVSGKFLLEPGNRVIMRAATPGIVTAVYGEEGKLIGADAPLFQLRNTSLQSKLALSKANFQMATERANSAVLRYNGAGALAQQRELLGTQTSLLAAQAGELTVISPISGVVSTPRMQDRLGSYVTEGTELVEIDDLGTMRARIYVSEYELAKFKIGYQARLEVDGLARKWHAHASNIAAISSEIDETLADRAQYKGLNPPNFYVVDLLVENLDGRLKPGMAGLARIYGQKVSIAGYLWTELNSFWGRKVW
jgi:multidrug resistance efflux pump